MSRRLKVAIKIAGAVLGSVVLIIAFLIFMSLRPFPVESLQLKEASLYAGTSEGTVQDFSVRVTNTSQETAVRGIAFRIDIYDRNGNSLDGRLFTIDDVIPSQSTRLVAYHYLGIRGLPPKGNWTWQYRVVGAKSAWGFEAYR